MNWEKNKVEGMTTDAKLLAQDDIDTLLGEAGLEGSYDEERKKKQAPAPGKKASSVRFTKKTDLDVKGTMEQLYSRALLERDEDVKVIWNAAGTIPMLTGSNMKIHDSDYVTLGTLYENHLVVKNT